jgi:iron complex outermembrane receptor protein
MAGKQKRNRGRQSGKGMFGGMAAAIAAVAGLTPVAHAQAQAPETEADVVITAERRAQRLDKVPIAATVLNADALAERGVNDALDLQNVSPSLVINTYNRTAYVNIRGTGLALSAPNVFQGVPFYLNGAMLPYDSTIRGSFYDVSSVEVLRGPQGTLSGLNSTGGAVYFRSKAPSFAGLSGFFEQGFHEYNGIRSVAGVNVPIGDKFALRVAGMNEIQDSWVTNTGSVSQPGDTDNYGFRADALFKPVDSLRVNLRGEYYRSDTDYNAVKRRDDFTDPFVIGEDGNSKSVVNNARGDLEVNWDATSAFSVRFQSAYGEGYQWDLGDRNRRIGGAQNNLSYTRIDPRSWSNEINLISSGDGKFQWVAGLFHLSNSTPTYLFRYANPSNPIPGGGDSLTADLDIDNEHKAVFAQGTYSFNDQWDLTIGARYSEDQQDFHRLAGVVLNAGPPVLDVFKSEEPTGRIALTFKPSDVTMFYGSLARGYKAGGVNLTIGDPPFQPESNVVGELGVKTSFFDRRLQLNAAIFHADYSDAQFAALAGAPPLPTTRNAPSVKSKGAELELVGNFGDLRFTAGGSYLDAEFDQAVMLQNPGTNTLQLVPEGRRMTFSPEWTFNGGVEYDLHVLGGVLTPRIQYSFVDDQFATPFPNGPIANPTEQNSLVPSHGVWDARLSFAPTEDIDVELFVNNIADERYIASQLQNASSQVGGYIYGAPRTVGVRLKVAFNE